LRFGIPQDDPRPDPVRPAEAPADLAPARGGARRPLRLHQERRARRAGDALPAGRGVQPRPSCCPPARARGVVRLSLGRVRLLRHSRLSPRHLSLRAHRHPGHPHHQLDDLRRPRHRRALAAVHRGRCRCAPPRAARAGRDAFLRRRAPAPRAPLPTVRRLLRRDLPALPSGGRRVDGGMKDLFYTTYCSGRSGLSNSIMSIELGVLLAFLTDRVLVLDGNISPIAHVSYGGKTSRRHLSRTTDLLEIPIPWLSAEQIDLEGRGRSMELTD